MAVVRLSRLLVCEAQAVAAAPSMLSRPLDQVEVWLAGAWDPETEAGPHQADKSPVATAAAPPENYILAAALHTLDTPPPLVSDLDTRTGPNRRHWGV